MHAEWSVECAADDPVLVIPWNDPVRAASFVDLRAHPAAIDAIPEAEAHPPLMQALRALNTSRSAVFTAKCDAWRMKQDELDQLRIDLGLDLGPDDTAEAVAELQASFGFISYVDLVCRNRALFASLPRHEHLLRGIVRLAATLEHPHAALECVLRPAFLDLEGPEQGYAISLYVKALGDSPQQAGSAWAAALSDAVSLLRRPIR